jgi:hypothetical protein
MSLREQARAVVALAVAAESIRRSIDHETIGWEDFPEIHENDWSHIVAEAILISVKSRPDKGELEDALKLLCVSSPVPDYDDDSDTADSLDPTED